MTIHRPTGIRFRRCSNQFWAGGEQTSYLNHSNALSMEVSGTFVCSSSTKKQEKWDTKSSVMEDRSKHDSFVMDCRVVSFLFLRKKSSHLRLLVEGLTVVATSPPPHKHPCSVRVSFYLKYFFCT